MGSFAKEKTMFLRKYHLLCLCLLTIAFPVIAQESWRASEVRPLPIPNDASARIFPAPDGVQAAYERAVRLDSHRDYYLCVVNAATQEEPKCVLAPQTLPAGFEPDPNSPLVPFSWSPDSRQIAAVGQPLGTQADTDLWILDVETGEWRNLADDNYDGALTAKDGNPAPPAGVSIELQPTWSPDGSQIAVERSVISESGEYAPSTIALLNVESGEVHDLTVLPGSTPGVADAGSTTGIAWSPDGSALALSVRHREANGDADGIWKLGVVTGSLEKLISRDDAQQAFQNIFEGLPLESIGPVSWSPDGKRLLVWFGNPAKRPAIAWPFWFDLTTGKLESVPVPTHPNDKPGRRAVRPLQAAWSPDGATLLLLTFGFPPDEVVNLLDSNASSPRLSVRIADVASSTAQVLGHLPLGPSTAPYYAVWGANGAITDGYYLKIER